jgi:hypothetical protein
MKELTEAKKTFMAKALEASKATVSVEVKLDDGKLTLEDRPITLDLLKQQITDCATSDRQIAKATETAKVRNTRVGTTLDTMTKALNCFPLSLINNGSSVTTLLEKNPKYNKKQLTKAMPYFQFFMETCKELKISPQQIKKSSAYYEGAGKTDDAVKRAEELGIVEEGTLEAIKEERDSKKDDAKDRRAERIANEERRDTEPSLWQLGELNTYITMWKEKEISNESIKAQVDDVISVLLKASASLDEVATNHTDFHAIKPIK